LDSGWREIVSRRGRATADFRCAFALKRIDGVGAGDGRRSGGRSVALSTHPPEEATRVHACLGRIARRHGQRVSLRFERLVNRREVRIDGERIRSARHSWSLTGTVSTASGANIPVGWSGGGDGMATLEGPACHDRLDWLAAAVGQASQGDAGGTRVVLAPQAAAVLLHEAIGHFAEASADPNTDLSHRIGCRLAAEALVVVDDARHCSAAARYAYDDEGIAAIGPTELVCNGRLQAQLHSRASARCAHSLPTGNGRAALWSAPVPRMSNLVCQPGTESLAGLIEKVWRGLLVHHLAYGYAAGLFVGAQVLLAETIERGRLTGRYVTGLNVADRTDLFLRLQGIGECSELNLNAMCGKAGQLLFDVGTRAPALALARLELRP
jgi:predicted Zn-dependent protease